MTRPNRLPAITSFALVVIATATLPACSTLDTPEPTDPEIGARETLHVMRSRREARSATSDWCSRARTGFEPFANGSHLEDRLSLWAVGLSSGHTKVKTISRHRVGEFRTCLGPTERPGAFNFHIEGTVSGVSLKGTGVCFTLIVDKPEEGLAAVACNVPLRSMSAPYVGGVLVANTMQSRAATGAASDPPGFTQTSIATIRMWR